MYVLLSCLEKISKNFKSILKPQTENSSDSATGIQFPQVSVFPEMKDDDRPGPNVFFIYFFFFCYYQELL